MQGDAKHTTKHTEDWSTTTVRPRRAAVLAVVPVAIGLLAAGCGGGSPTGGVAHLGSSTPSASSTAAGATAGPGVGESSPGSKAVAFSACMRSHGVANFPDPQISRNGNEVSVKIAVPAGVGNPQLKSAQRACRKLLPGGGGVGPVNQPVVSPAEQTQYLKAAACVRAHGLPNFPDPTFSGGGVHIDHQGLNESSPVFKAAVRACESLIPGGVHGGSGSAHEAAR